MLLNKAPPPKRVIQVPKGATGLGFIKADGESTTIVIGDHDLIIRAQKRTNVAPGLSKVHFQGLFYVAHAGRVYIFLNALQTRVAQGVFSLADPELGNVLVNTEIRRRPVKPKSG